MLRSFIVLLLISGLSSELQAQKNEAKKLHPWSFGVNGYYGALFRYRKGTSLVNFTDPYAIEIYANLQTKGKRLWERQYRYPQVGFAFSYYNYGVPQELGKAYSITGYIDNTLLKWKKSSLRLNLGTGLVYSTRYYIPNENELNKAIGSKICFALRGTIRYEVKLYEKLFLNLNLAFRHFSNGGLNKPNNGMNFPLLGAGIRYQPHEVKRILSKKATQSYDRSIHFNLRVATGRKEVLLVDEKHPVYSLSMYVSKKVSPINGLLLGMDGIIDTSLRNEFINDFLPPPEEDPDPKMAGITLGHELYIGDVSFIFQLGRYIYEPNDLFPDFYQRYGLQYYPIKNLSVSAMLMAHTRTADFIEFGLGVHL